MSPRNGRQRARLSEAAIIVGLLLLPLLFWWRLWALSPGDRAVIPEGDFTSQYYPLQLFAARGLAEGWLPAWDPYINAGQPGLADIQTGVFYPLNLLPNLVLALFGLPFSLGVLTAQVIVHFSLASLFSYLFIRHLALRSGSRIAAARFAGVVAALAFTYGGYLTSFPVQQLTILETAIWLPLVLFFLDRAICRSRPLSQLLLAGMALACSILAGHPQTALYVVYGVLAYGLFRAWTTVRQKPELPVPRRILRTAYLVLLPLVLGAALAAIQLVPTLDLIRRSTRAGLDYSGVSWGFPLTEITHYLNFPITNTLMGLGGYPATDRQFLGMLGMHGTYEANMAMHESDVLIAVGSRFDDRVTGKIAHFCPQAKIIHIDIDPSSISKNVRVDVPIVGSVKSVLSDMLKVLRESGARPHPENLENWWERIEAWRGLDCLYYEQNGELIKPQYAVEVMNKVTHGDAFVTSDVGQHQMFAAQFYQFDKPRRWINSGGLGTMGFGLPAAMGVQFAHPDSTVACVTGEASILMCIQELATCKQYDLPVKIVLLNNGYMGMVRQWQEMFYEGRYSHSYVDALPDFVQLAESFGHVGMRVSTPGDLEDAMTEMFDRKKELVFMDVAVDPEVNVYPMIEAGKGHHEMHMSPENKKRGAA
ncbi:MAG: thiamine pyrophosphate-dependent enzyme [Gammaproteobacteria bacterium]